MVWDQRKSWFQRLHWNAYLDTTLTTELETTGFKNAGQANADLYTFAVIGPTVLVGVAASGKLVSLKNRIRFFVFS